MSRKGRGFVATSLLIALVSLAGSADGQPKRSPAEVSDLWHRALFDGRINDAISLTSATYWRAYSEPGLAPDPALLEIEGNGRRISLFAGALVDRCSVDDHWIEGKSNSARVAYRCTYRDGDYTVFRDTLLLEQGGWKIAPHMVYMEYNCVVCVPKKTLRCQRTSIAAHACK